MTTVVLGIYIFSVAAISCFHTAFRGRDERGERVILINLKIFIKKNIRVGQKAKSSLDKK